MLAFGEGGQWGEGLEREGLIVDRALVAGHLLWKRTTCVELVDGLFVDANAPVEEVIVRREHAHRDGREAAPVMVIVGLSPRLVDLDGVVRDLVHPLDVALHDCWIKRG